MSRDDGPGEPRISAREYRRGRWAVAVAGLLGGGLALVGRWVVGAPVFDGDGWAGAIAVAIAGAALAVLVALLLRRYGARRDRLVARVREARPGAGVIPGYASRDLWSDAVAAGVGTRGLTRRWTTTLAVAVVGDRAEIWVRGDRGPRWSVRLTGMRVELHPIGMGTDTQLGLRISDGAKAASFVPHYGVVGSVGSVERALRDLGRDPADHLAP